MQQICQFLKYFIRNSCHNVTLYSDHVIQNAFVHEILEYQILRNLHIYVTVVKLAAM